MYARMLGLERLETARGRAAKRDCRAPAAVGRHDRCISAMARYLILFLGISAAAQGHDILTDHLGPRDLADHFTSAALPVITTREWLSR